MTTTSTLRRSTRKTPAAAAPLTMKAAILTKQHSPLLVANDVEIPELSVGQVLAKIAFSGICGKQLEEIDGRRGADPFLPHLLGHEGAGTVVRVGPGVRKVKAGDRIVLHWMKGSGVDASPATFQRNGNRVNAGCVTTFSQYTVASENRVTPIPTTIPFDVASLLGCAVTTGLGIVFNNASLNPGQSIAVFGVGGVGLNVLQGAVLVNAYPIVAIDLHDHKLAQAMNCGATHTVRADRSDLPAVLSELSGGHGFDVAVDLTGETSVRELVYRSTSNTGRTILAGVPHVGAQMHIDSFPLHFGRRILGVHGGDTQPDRDIPRYLKLYMLGKLKLKEQITHRYTLDQVNEAVECVRRGEAGRCVIAMS